MEMLLLIEEAVLERLVLFLYITSCYQYVYWTSMYTYFEYFFNNLKQKHIYTPVIELFQLGSSKCLHVGARYFGDL